MLTSRTMFMMQCYKLRTTGSKLTDRKSVLGVRWSGDSKRLLNAKQSPSAVRLTKQEQSETK